MHIHILGICGTFMGGLAILARQLGHTVTGSDANVYPPMSTQLEAQGIELMVGYHAEHLQPAPDLVVVGNAMSRGNPAVEYLLDKGLPYTSGPQWLSEHLLQDRWVLACAGTHGKTSTSSMLAWILEFADMQPGYLIGGVPGNFGLSARLGESSFFVIEADEYDSAFFDKRSKFVHYRPRTAVLNNLEFDHADIFDDLAAIQKQFHHLVRIIPSTGRIIVPVDDNNIAEVIEQGCWSELEKIGINQDADWQAELLSADGGTFSVAFNGANAGTVRWDNTGNHNVSNALAAIAAARHVGVKPQIAVEALCQFKGVKRRMEILAKINGITVYDDFAHHPTAIETTLAGLRAKVANEKIIAVIEPRSNTMRMGTHLARLAESTAEADRVIWYQPEGMDWSLDSVIAASDGCAAIQRDINAIVKELVASSQAGDHIVIMSNGGFGGIHQLLLDALNNSSNSR
jgi:UDP-N-acetylmuramate: L-alanyl-gamma-D-glutamyl-meso-diaminopimelate ligase